MSTSPASARSEWAAYWYLPLTAALGISASGLHIYGIGPFMAPIQHDFGWTRAQTLSGTAIVSLGVALGSLPMGALIDRWGPRRIALVGVLVMGAAVALLGAATGTMVNWWILWSIVALTATSVQSMVWTSAVVSRFDAARGLALGITLSGNSFAVFAMPLLSTWLVASFGWRHAFIGLGGIWALTSFPVLYLFFRGAHDGERVPRHRSIPQASSIPGLSLTEALREPAFRKLMFATAFFVLVVYGGVIHFVPILTGNGASPLVAAGAASTIGIFSLIGRLGTAAMIDRLPAHIIGAVSFVLPIPACVILLTNGLGTAGYFASATMFGLTLGAEIDVITYLAAQRFGLRSFGAVQGSLLCAMAVGAALGPLAAGAVFDHFGNYTYFLLSSSLILLVSAVLIGSIGPAPARAALSSDQKHQPTGTALESAAASKEGLKN